MTAPQESAHRPGMVWLWVIALIVLPNSPLVGAILLIFVLLLTVWRHYAPALEVWKQNQESLAAERAQGEFARLDAQTARLESETARQAELPVFTRGTLRSARRFARGSTLAPPSA